MAEEEDTLDYDMGQEDANISVAAEMEKYWSDKRAHHQRNKVKLRKNWALRKTAKTSTGKKASAASGTRQTRSTSRTIPVIREDSASRSRSRSRSPMLPEHGGHPSVRATKTTAGSKTPVVNRKNKKDSILDLTDEELEVLGKLFLARTLTYKAGGDRYKKRKEWADLVDTANTEIYKRRFREYKDPEDYVTALHSMQKRGVRSSFKTGRKTKLEETCEKLADDDTWRKETDVPRPDFPGDEDTVNTQSPRNE